MSKDALLQIGFGLVASSNDQTQKASPIAGSTSLRTVSFPDEARAGDGQHSRRSRLDAHDPAFLPPGRIFAEYSSTLAAPAHRVAYPEENPSITPRSARPRPLDPIDEATTLP